MSSLPHGNSASGIEVTNVSSHGFWLLVDDEEYFLAFENFPWFRDATIAQINNIERQGEGGFYWPDLEVDLSLEIIKHPEKYPLVSKI
jgi:hypothetical protein